MWMIINGCDSVETFWGICCEPQANQHKHNLMQLFEIDWTIETIIWYDVKDQITISINGIKIINVLFVCVFWMTCILLFNSHDILIIIK